MESEKREREILKLEGQLLQQSGVWGVGIGPAQSRNGEHELRVGVSSDNTHLANPRA